MSSENGKSIDDIERLEQIIRDQQAQLQKEKEFQLEFIRASIDALYVVIPQYVPGIRQTTVKAISDDMNAYTVKRLRLVSAANALLKSAQPLDGNET